MTVVRTIVFLTSLGMAVFLPRESAGQTTAAATPTREQPGTSTDVSLDTSQRLEGRLFFTAQERQVIDEARKRGRSPGDDGKYMDAPPSVLNGFVKRNDGSTTIWVDGDVRWNAKSRNADSLVPSDVGGPADYVKVSDANEKSRSMKPVTRAKKPAKPVAKAPAIPMPRLLP